MGWLEYSLKPSRIVGIIHNPCRIPHMFQGVGPCTALKPGAPRYLPRAGLRPPSRLRERIRRETNIENLKAENQWVAKTLQERDMLQYRFPKARYYTVITLFQSVTSFWFPESGLLQLLLQRGAQVWTSNPLPREFLGEDSWRFSGLSVRASRSTHFCPCSLGVNPFERKTSTHTPGILQLQQLKSPK